jgi:hypothetical protein
MNPWPPVPNIQFCITIHQRITIETTINIRLIVIKKEDFLFIYCGKGGKRGFVYVCLNGCFFSYSLFSICVYTCVHE